MTHPLPARRPVWTLAWMAAVAAGMGFAFHRRLLVDDAFISFRYARNLVDGFGLAWNPADRVEGYTNFLWVLLMAAGMKLGVTPETVSLVMAVLVHLAGLVLCYLLALRILNSRPLAILAVLLVGLNRSVAGFATSGLETPLQFLEFLAAGYLITRAHRSGWTDRATMGFSVLLALALLTRPDAVVLIVPAVLFWFLTLRGPRRRDAALLAVPFLLLVVPWLAWKLVFYGSLLPNSFAVKVAGPSGFGAGLAFVYMFLWHYLLIPFLAIAVLCGPRLHARNLPAFRLLAVAVLWMLYVASVGGDFMEFRFFVPVVPFLVIGFLAVLKIFVADRRVRAALLGVLVLGTFHNLIPYSRYFYRIRIERIEEMNAHLYAPGENWAGIGSRLGELFGGTDVTLAVAAAGAIPYYSGLSTIDFLGLNDRTIPRIGRRRDVGAGHRIVAPLSYLQDRNVNLIVQPFNLMIPQGQLRSAVGFLGWGLVDRFSLDLSEPVDGGVLDRAEMIAVPIEHGYSLIVWYFTPHPAVEAAVREHGLARFTVERGPEPTP